MVEDESEVFEITDFTTASEWERFVAKLEEIIHEWKLPHVTAGARLTKGELTTGTWEEKVANVQFADFNFTITRHSLRQSNLETSQSSASIAPDPTKPSATIDEDDRNDLPFIWQDMMCAENSFPSRAHCLCRWYGLRDFVVIATAPGMDDIMSESRVNMLISSMSIAANNTGCQVPIFVQFHSKWRRLFAGISEHSGFRTSFDMVQLKNTPHQCNNLYGLLDVFKSKITASPLPLPETAIAVRLTYVLQDWTQYSWPQLPPDFDSLTGEIGVTEFGILPFGAYEDPVCELHLSTTWPAIGENSFSETTSYSDLDPIYAPHWSVRVRVADNPQCLLGDYLNGFVKFCSRKESTQQLLGKSIVVSDSELDVSQALHRLTDPGPYVLPSIGKAVKRATSKLALKPEEAPIPAELLNEILLFLFPDARDASAKAKGSSVSASSSSTNVGTLDMADGTMTLSPSEQDLQASDIPGCQFKFQGRWLHDWPLGGHLRGAGVLGYSLRAFRHGVLGQLTGQEMEMFRQLKSAPLGSLTSRLAICMCIINHSHGGLRAVAHLWQEFVLEMRYRWENNYVIPDLDPGNPNMGCCLLHQKLQMLNCCIERKKSRELLAADHGIEASSLVPEDPMSSSNKETSLSSDDEFFECGEEDTASDSAEKDVASPAKGQEKPESAEVPIISDALTTVESAENEDALLCSSIASSVGQSSNADSSLFAESLTYQPEGRLGQHQDLMLLNVNEPLYLPVTQEPSPMTEDLLEEHAEVLAKLGTSAEGAHLRARMQSACLLSDMEAFKAANPGCVLGDFVRWYSPRDWVEEKITNDDGNEKYVGQLSQRMQIPGNMWLEVWQNARPTPARRQRRLFDDTKEAEKVLHWLASMKPADVAVRLMPMLVHAAITKLMEKDKCQLPLLKKMLAQIINKGTKATRSISNEAKRYEDLVRHISLAEVIVTRAQSLLAKLQQEKQDLDLKTSDLEQFVSDLLEHPEVNIVGAARSPLGTIIHRLFVTSYKADLASSGAEDEASSGDTRERIQRKSEFPQPVGKEFILRNVVRRPAPWSRPSPQRMYCVLMKDDFRLAGAFTCDTTFQ